jgi:hypothetical protein
MKRLFAHIVTIVALVSILVGCTRDKAKGDYTCAIPDSAVMVARCDLNQLLDKSGVRAKLIQAIQTKLESEHMPDFILDMVKDFRCTGIDIEAPIYLYAQPLDNENVFVGVVAKTFKEGFFDSIIKRVGKGKTTRVEESKYTLVQSNEYNAIALAYNDLAIILGAVISPKNNSLASGGDARPYVVEAAINAYDGGCGGSFLPRYEGSDVAICWRGAQPGGGRIDFELNTSDGVVECSGAISGVADAEGYQPRHCSNKYLKYVPADALAVANVPLDSERTLWAINELLTSGPEVEEMLDKLCWVMGIKGYNVEWESVASLLRTTEENATIAVNRIDIKGVRTSVVVDVADDSIMNLVEQTRAAAGVKEAKWQFSQNGKMLCATTACVVEEQSHPITEAKWFPAVEGCYGYLFANLSSIFASPVVKMVLPTIVEEQCGELSGRVITWLDGLDHLLITAPTPESVKLQLRFKDRGTNPMAQIINMANFNFYNML